MMHKLLIGTVVAAALVAAAPAAAQRMSLAERVALLEQRAGDNQANIDLLRQVNLLKDEVQSLRAQLEELEHQHGQLRQTARAQYLDLDGRLNRMDAERGAPSGAELPVTPQDLPEGSTDLTLPDADAADDVDADAIDDTDAAGESDEPAAASAADRNDEADANGRGRDASAVAGGDGRASPEGEDEAYDAAFDHLKAGEYARAAESFQSFLDRYPGGSHAPNALYWLGESYYVIEDYELAQRQFQSLLDRYPAHDKAPGALLKVGLSQHGRDQLDAAERTLSEVIERYPGTDAARTAEDRLNAIDIGRLR